MNQETQQAYQRVLKNIRVSHDATNTHFKNAYVTLRTLLATVTPVLEAEGFLLRERTTVQSPDRSYVTSESVTSESGTETAQATYPLYLEHSLTLFYNGAIVDCSQYFVCYCGVSPQAQGAALTYTRRYHIMSFLGLASHDDDDGNTAQQQMQSVVMKRKVR